ncbi:hypothetical protein [Streptomyces violarus]|uniref:hypothetical protein n=1 Tax=Streptomyces violarus TaxID=67380 RepID=UPI0021C0A241|nr:hypothetical protein [Streptomyces violarus]MCT9137650.1 hypothetical protein [Streptomyces violarus]
MPETATSIPGFSTDSPLGTQLVFDDALVREIPERQLRRMVRADTVSATKDAVVFYAARSLADIGRYRVVICARPKELQGREGHPPSRESTAEHEEDAWSDHHAGRKTSRPTCQPLSGAALLSSGTSGAAERRR